MRPISLRVPLLGIVLLLACSDGAPPSSPLSPLPARFAAVTTRGTSSFAFEGTDFLACVGEAVHLRGEGPFTFQATVTPSGNTIFADHFVVGTWSGTAEGLTSGTRWTLTRLVSPEVIRTTAGSSAFFGSNAFWTSSTGPSFSLHQNFHIVQSANGEIRVERFDNECRAH